MDRRILQIIVVSMVWFAAVFTVNAYQIECPKELKIKKNIENLPDGWEVIKIDDNVIYEPSSIAVYYDKPIKMLNQKPEKHLIGRKNWGKQFEYTWQVNLTNDTEPYYVNCNYVGSSIEIIKKIDRSMKSCKGFYSEDKYSNEINNTTSINCTTGEAKNTK